MRPAAFGKSIYGKMKAGLVWGVSLTRIVRG
jgi:hypothetical protein